MVYRATRELFDYIEVFYNQRSRHSTIGRISPARADDSGGVTKLSTGSGPLKVRSGRICLNVAAYESRVGAATARALETVRQHRRGKWPFVVSDVFATAPAGVDAAGCPIGVGVVSSTLET